MSCPTIKDNVLPVPDLEDHLLSVLGTKYFLRFTKKEPLQTS